MIRAIKRNKVRGLIKENLEKGKRPRLNHRIGPVWEAMRIYRAEETVKILSKELKKDKKNEELKLAVAEAKKVL